MLARMVLYGNRVNRSRAAGARGPIEQKVQIARIASDADTLAASTRYAAHPGREVVAEGKIS